MKKSKVAFLLEWYRENRKRLENNNFEVDISFDNHYEDRPSCAFACSNQEFAIELSYWETGEMSIQIANLSGINKDRQTS